MILKVGIADHVCDSHLSRRSEYRTLPEAMRHIERILIELTLKHGAQLSIVDSIPVSFTREGPTVYAQIDIELEGDAEWTAKLLADAAEFRKKLRRGK